MYYIYKLVAQEGMNLTILVAYRLIFATAAMIPPALIFERGSLSQNLYIESLALTSATYAAAMLNLVPAITLQSS
ncbi:hypothetical protein CerSpe_249930 [Prunus speciosa]